MNSWHLEWDENENDFFVEPHTDIGWFSLGRLDLPFTNSVQIDRRNHIGIINEFLFYFGFNPSETEYVSSNIDTAGQ